MPWPSAFTAGAVLTAAQLNGIQAIGQAWTVDTRASSAIWQANTTNPAIGNGVLTSRYRLTGKTCDWEVVITMGSSTTFGSGVWQMVPPVAPKTTDGEYPLGTAFDTSSGNRFMVYGIKGSGFFTLQASVTAGALTSLTSTAPMTWTNGDMLSFQTTYETV